MARSVFAIATLGAQHLSSESILSYSLNIYQSDTLIPIVPKSRRVERDGAIGK